MASLAPAFTENGSVTAATSSPLTDGATSGWVIESDLARQLGVASGLEIVDAQVAHVPPELMGMGPVPATRKIFERNGLSPADIAVYEINEAFAIQVLASSTELGIPLERINGWGGAMAAGTSAGGQRFATRHDAARSVETIGRSRCIRNRHAVRWWRARHVGLVSLDEALVLRQVLVLGSAAVR